MGTPRQHARAGLLGGAALLLVLLGVLAMYGFGGHGNGNATPTAASHHAATTWQWGTHAVHAAAGAAEHTTPDEPAHASWTALCLAVLAGAALLVLVTRRAAGALVRSGLPGPSMRLPGRRDRDPPSLVLLSVRRC